MTLSISIFLEVLQGSIILLSNLLHSHDFVNAPDLRFYVVFANNNEPIEVWLFNNTYEFRSLYKPMVWLVTKCIIHCKHNFSDVYLPRWVCGVWSILMPTCDFTNQSSTYQWLLCIFILCVFYKIHHTTIKNCSSFNETVRSIYTTQADTKMQHP